MLQVEKTGAKSRRDNNLFHPVQRSFSDEYASIVEVEQRICVTRRNKGAAPGVCGLFTANFLQLQREGEHIFGLGRSGKDCLRWGNEVSKAAGRKILPDSGKYPPS